MIVRTLTPSGSGPAFAAGFGPGVGSGVPLTQSRCHACMASASFPPPRTFRLTFLPSSVTYQVSLLALYHGLLGRAIASALAMPSSKGAPAPAGFRQREVGQGVRSRPPAGTRTA